MAATAEGTWLTEAHRAAQLRLRARTAAEIGRLMRGLNLNAVGVSWARIEPRIAAVIAAGNRASARLTADYVGAFRAAENVPGSSPPTVLAGPPPAGQVIGNLRILGPGVARRLAVERPADAMRVVLSNVEGEASRLVLNGGRDTLVETIRRDPRALGYTRVTDGSPCAFCAMLAARGPVYRADSVAFEAHRKCGCVGEPVYRPDQPWPGSAERWRDLYDEVKAAGGTSAAIRAEFRRRYDAGR